MDETNTVDDALVLIQTRNAFYKQKYYWGLAILLLCVAVIVVLSSILGYLAKNPVKPFYFLTDSVGRLIQEIPVTTPNMSDDAVSGWVVEAVEAANSYNFMNYRAQLQNAE